MNIFRDPRDPRYTYVHDEPMPLIYRPSAMCKTLEVWDIEVLAKGYGVTSITAYRQIGWASVILRLQDDMQRAGLVERAFGGKRNYGAGLGGNGETRR